jgi:hypothetical protein
MCATLFIKYDMAKPLGFLTPCLYYYEFEQQYYIEGSLGRIVLDSISCPFGRQFHVKNVLKHVKIGNFCTLKQHPHIFEFKRSY